MTDTTHEAAQRLIAEATHEAWDVEVVDLIGTLLAERDMWRDENVKKQTACEQMAARIVALEWAVIAARHGGVEAAIAVASQRAASRHGEVTHCVSDRSKKHMQVRADEAGKLVADLRALRENSHD